MANGIPKDPSFHTDFQNESAVFVKSAPQKIFSQKTALRIEKSAKSQKNRFFG
jgi:hypothetical protein